MTTVVGVDSAKNRVDAVALSEGKICDWFTMEISVKNVVSRDQTLKDIRFSFNFWLRCLPEPPIIYVESSIVANGRQTAVALGETVGMILSLPFPVEKVAIDSWKQLVVGKGGVSKELVKEAIVDQFPATADLFGARQDLFDATGVALYGYRVGRSAPAADASGG